MASAEPAVARSAGSGRRGLNPERRERVLQAAADALLERGLADTRIADIAARAGMSPGHVMYYFDSKEQILMEALRHKEDTLFYAHVDEPADAEPWERLVAWIDRSIPTGARDEQWTLWVELYAVSIQDPEIARLLDERDRRWTDTLRAIVNEGVHLRVFACPRPDRFVGRLTALITGWAVPIAAGSRTADRTKAIEDCVDLAAGELLVDRLP